ncbi:peptide N-acetyl-beta-D-glucosaminyl asparaginase amidase A-domain-containing protein [Cadophora sp. MPI-SDFR-AT-0126]|nr:peptide N-acetyl-beta-D-glucosaminyl asparaginase amidase A-domain-containing protein [Leotiomycetes sp. MPI-SDFR-AT-0126]
MLSFLGFCVAALGWVVFFSSRLIAPRQEVAPVETEESVLDFYSHVAVDLYPRKPQDTALSVLQLSSATVPYTGSVSSTISSTGTAGSGSSLGTSSASASTSTSVTALPDSSLTTVLPESPSSAAPSSSIFQLDPPVMGPGQVVLDDGIGNIRKGDDSSSVNAAGGSLCQVTLMEHEFIDSFGKPFVGKFTPPACMGNSNTVIMNFTVRSFGGQFDRLATMYFGDTEVFRTSTAEPKKSGIVWTYMKDMSHLMSLWKVPQKVIFDLPNQTNVNITGTYMTSLTATFFSASEPVDAANVILPLSAKRGINESLPSTFIVPSTTQNATITLSAGSIPRNAKRAIVSIAATGQGDEEFWWQNVLSSAVSTYNASGGVLFGDSPFREVQLWLDGQMAGVVWPFPVIFTGGIVPAFWSPMVGIQAFDLSEGEIDVTPWLGSLCDGKAHTFDMKVVGLSDNAGKTAVINQGVGSNWVLSGKIFIWTESNTTTPTTSDLIKISSSDPEISVSQTIQQNATGGNDTLVYTTSVRRSLTITSNIKTSQYPNGREAIWTQSLSQTTNNALTSQGNVQSNTHATSGKDSFLLGAQTPYTKTYSYPLFANTTVTNLQNGAIRIDATIDRTYHSEISGQGASPSGLQPFANLAASTRLVETLAGTTLSQSQSGNATLIFAPGSSGGVAANGSAVFGSLVGTARFGGRSSQGVLGMEKDEELWFRMVGAVNGSLKEDVQRVNGKGVAGGLGVVNASSSAIGFGLVDLGPGRFLGRNIRDIGG